MNAFELSEGWLLVLIGLLLLGGYSAHLLGRQLHVPRVTLLILLGIAVGPHALDLVPGAVADWFPYIAHFSLAMVGFLLGEAFAGRELKSLGKRIIWLPLIYVLVTAAMVGVGVYCVEGSLVVALIVAGMAPAVDPAATVDLIREHRAHGPLSQTLLKVVALDDVFGVVAFSMLFAIAEAISGGGTPLAETLRGSWDVAGAVLLGVLLGWPMAWLTGRLKPGEPALLEAAGFVFLCGGIATLIEVSYLIACVVLGTVVANRAKHHTRPFHAIEGAVDPFLVAFFMLAGYRLELDVLPLIGGLGVVYIATRSLGLIAGGWLSAALVGAEPVVRKRLGWCLLPQAGVALGLALLAGERFPAVNDMLLPLAIASTVIFEIVGPIVSQYQLFRAGEIGRRQQKLPI